MSYSAPRYQHCTIYLKSSLYTLYNLITALKRGAQYSCFLSSSWSCEGSSHVSGPRCLGRGQHAGEHRGQAGGREARGQQRGRDPEWPSQQRHGGDPDPLHLWLLESLCFGAPVLKPDLDLELEKIRVLGGGEISQPDRVLALWVSIIYFISAPFARIVTRHPPGSRRVWGLHWTPPSRRCWGTASPCTSSPGCWAARWWRVSGAFCLVCVSSGGSELARAGAAGSCL